MQSYTDLTHWSVVLCVVHPPCHAVPRLKSKLDEYDSQLQKEGLVACRDKGLTK